MCTRLLQVHHVDDSTADLLDAPPWSFVNAFNQTVHVVLVSSWGLSVPLVTLDTDSKDPNTSISLSSIVMDQTIPVGSSVDVSTCVYWIWLYSTCVLLDRCLYSDLFDFVRMSPA